MSDRQTVVIHTGQAWEPWNWETLHTTGIGGSETCTAYLAKVLVEKGYRSVIIGDCADREGIFEGVEYIHHTRFNEFKNLNYIDHFISSRRFEPTMHPIRNGKNYVWSHDIWVNDLPATNIPDDITFVCLSPWHQRFFCEHHQLDLRQTVIIGNGIDVTNYVNPVEKDPYRLFYSSCPSRGLITLLDMFPHWKREFPLLNLHIYYGFDNWKKMIEQNGSTEQREHLKAIEDRFSQPGVHFHGRVSQKLLAQEQMKSALWVYPTTFRETYCITALEAMLSGAVPICTNFMTPQGPSTLEYTVPDDCGIKVATPEECFVATRNALLNSEQLESYRIAGREYVTNNCSWDKIVDKWIELFNKPQKEKPMSLLSAPATGLAMPQIQKPFKLAIGLPMLHPFVHYKFVNSYLALQRPEGSIAISLVGSLTALARNQIVDIALSNPHFTHLLFLDTDMTFPPDTIKKLISHNKDIVSGLYFERYAPYRPVLRKRFEDGYSLVDHTQSSLVECDALGAGCLLIKMDVFKEIGKPYFEYRLTQTGIKETFLSEDIVFCERVREAGYRIWCDTTIRCGHLISDYEITEANWDGSSDHKVQNWG